MMPCMNNTQVTRLVAYMTGMVNQQLLLQNEYLAAENKILRAHLPARLRLTDAQRSTLAEIGKRLGRQVLQQVARVAKPDTILAWYRKLIAQKFDGSKYRRYPGRPSVSQEITRLLLRMRVRIPAGDMTASPVHWITSGTAFRTKP
jgi:putative transposase